jgi:capsular polysaccharide biosynthesis protein
VFGSQVRHTCGLAHAYLGLVKDARIFGPGFILTAEGNCLLHGLTHGNYQQVLVSQIKRYVARQVANGALELEIRDDAPFIDDEVVLLWGSRNFGHWIFTYLHRLLLLSRQPGLRDKKILVLDETPERYLPWLARMGIPEERVVRARDCTGVARLWVPSVLHYRGHYDDNDVYTFPDAVRLFRNLVLRQPAPAAPRGTKRERVYLSRAKAKWRRAVNEEELAARLEALDVRRVFMEELSLDEQIDVISRAELIVQATGAVSPMSMLAPEDVSIVEMSLPGFAGAFGSRVWAAILGQRYSRIEVAPVDTGIFMPVPETDRDGIVPIDKVVELIEAGDRGGSRRKMRDE